MSTFWHDGHLVEGDSARLDPWGTGLLHGDGLFETLRADDGRPRGVGAHLDRLLAGLKRIDLAIPEDRVALSEALAAVAAAGPRPVARLRLTVARGPADGPPTRLVTASAYEPPSPAAYGEGVAVLLDPKPRLFSRSPLAGLKSLSYQVHSLALAEARRRDAYEMLLLNEEGRVVEGSRTNLVVVREGKPLTPPLADGALPGTVRRRLLESGSLSERSVRPEDLFAADEILLTNSLIGVLPVASVNGRRGQIGPHGERLRQLVEGD